MLMQAGGEMRRSMVFELRDPNAAFAAAPPAAKTDGAAPSAWIAEISPTPDNIRAFRPTPSSLSCRHGRRSFN
jgi:hypothetical protein